MKPIIISRSLAFFLGLLLLTTRSGAQQVLEYTENAAGNVGVTYWYTDSYTAAGGCRNTVEFLPNGFDFNDPNTKYPLLIFFPGRNQTASPTDIFNNGSNPEGVKAPRLKENIFSWTWPSIIKVQTLPIPRYLLTYYSPVNVPGPANQTYSFIVVTVQCGPNDVIADYDKLIRGYVFEKYKDKIDPRRIYLTGLSLGGGKAMEYLADPSRAATIAAAAPVATGTECPFTPEFISTPGVLGPSPIPPVWSPCADQSQFNAIVQNVVNSTTLGLFFNHNLNDRSAAPVRITNFFFDAINAIQPGRAGGYFNPVAPSDPFDPTHDAWGRAYDPFITDYNGKNMYSWLLDFQSNNTLLPLPVRLRDFTVAKNSQGGVNLKWTTDMEQHTSHFSIERSVDGKNFLSIGTVRSAGNSNSLRNYVFVDDALLTQELYYRLKMVDLDGRYEYSPTKKIRFSNRGMKFTISPNPGVGPVRLLIEGEARGPLEFTLKDQAGRILIREKGEKTRQTFQWQPDLSGLATGLYFIRIAGDQVNHTMKLVKP